MAIVLRPGPRSSVHFSAYIPFSRDLSHLHTLTPKEAEKWGSHVPIQKWRENSCEQLAVCVTTRKIEKESKNRGWHCCSHVFPETKSIRRTIWSAVYYTGRPKAESPLSQGPQPVFVKTLYTLSVRAQTHLPKFLETCLDKVKERSKLTHDSCVISLDV